MALQKALIYLADWCIRGYQFILSPFLGNQCRFYPTCSAYARQAIRRHGFFKGVFLGSKRICRCHPYYKGEYHDEVPETFEWKELIRYKQAKHNSCCQKDV